MCMKAPRGASEVWNCSGQCPHSSTLDLYGMSRLLSQTVSLIYFKGWKKKKKKQHTLFCTRLSCGILSFDGIHKDPQPAADMRVWNQQKITRSELCCRQSNEQLLSGRHCYDPSRSPMVLELHRISPIECALSLYVSKHQNKLWSVPFPKKACVQVDQPASQDASAAPALLSGKLQIQIASQKLYVLFTFLLLFFPVILAYHILQLWGEMNWSWKVTW